MAGPYRLTDRSWFYVNADRASVDLVIDPTQRTAIVRLTPTLLKRMLRRVRAKLPYCLCGETDPSQFRESEPRRCKACRRAYNAKRKRALVRAEGSPV